MSDPHTPHDQDGPHEGPIKTTKQLILAVLYAFVVPIIVIILLVMYVTNSSRPAAGSNALTPEAVLQRIQPVARVQVKDASDLSTLKTGQQVFEAVCGSCHTAGLVGSPKFGDATAWAPRIKSGYESLLRSALVGKGQMGAQGGGDYADLEIGRAVVYMVNNAGGQFKEPQLSVAAAEPVPAVAAAPAVMPVAVAPVVAAPTGAAKVEVASAAAAPALYEQVCQACHVAGVAGAPKAGDVAAWAPRIALGVPALTASVINGKGAMPAKGGAASATEAEIKAAVVYMIGLAK
jgi:cytochrome c5